MSDTYEEAHSAVAVALAECFLTQPRDMAWEERTDQLATAAIEAIQLFISMRPVVRRYEARIAAASGIETGTAKSEALSAEHESPTAESGDAQRPPQ